MTKSELVQKLAEANPHLYQRDVEVIVTAIFDEIAAALARGDRVELRGFGFAVEPIDALDACFRTHDFFYHLGKQKTGDLQLAADLAAHDTDIARVCSRVFQWKAAHHSVDRDGDISFIVGAEDLYQRFAVQPPMHYRPHQPPVVLPLPQTLRDLVVSFLSVFL